MEGGKLCCSCQVDFQGAQFQHETLKRTSVWKDQSSQLPPAIKDFTAVGWTCYTPEGSWGQLLQCSLKAIFQREKRKGGTAPVEFGGVGGAHEQKEKERKDKQEKRA